MGATGGHLEVKVRASSFGWLREGAEEMKEGGEDGRCESGLEERCREKEWRV